MNKLLTGLFSLISTLLLCNILLAQVEQPEILSKQNISKALLYLKANIATQNNILNYSNNGYKCYSIPGAVVASPKGMNETWARDTAIVMATIAKLYKDAARKNDEAGIQLYGNLLINYVHWLNKTVAVLPADHAKFYINGKEFPWMNQADGPALRVITLTDMAEIFIRYPKKVVLPYTKKSVMLDENFVKKYLFNKQQGPENNLIKYETDFISSNWMKKTIDLWEGSSGNHFFAEIVQLKALLQAATLAKQFGNLNAAAEYLRQAYLINKDLSTFYHKWKYFGPKHNLSRPLSDFYCFTEERLPSQRPFSGKVPAKWYETWHRGSGLNSSIMLGVLYGNIYPQLQKKSLAYKELSGFTDYMKLVMKLRHNTLQFIPASNKIIQTVYHYQNAFSSRVVDPCGEGLDVYAVNNRDHTEGDYGPLVGRYPGDNYNGVDWSKVEVHGNPWFLTTISLARYYYVLFAEYKNSGSIRIPSENSRTPDVIKFFRQISGDRNLQADRTYNQDTLEFNEITNGLVRNANAIMNCVLQHTDNSMHMSEQIDRDTGKQASYANLSWSYSALIDTYEIYKNKLLT